jgi:hypothetical protein
VCVCVCVCACVCIHMYIYVCMYLYIYVLPGSCCCLQRSLRRGRRCSPAQTSAYVSLRQNKSQHTSAYDSIRQHTTAYVSIQTIRASYSKRSFSGTEFQIDTIRNSACVGDHKIKYIKKKKCHRSRSS